ncbi:uncharacterized protein M421DRAFT_395301 [Didymella exigua CBS 183.55]|uniref:Uncharacterized protein n=1 Tax=Didymella exigua CBS 183.55 TaxID=1150837 RepID=A0A6A5S0L1_9PLEO|nr:uncharacterized protein M421DRAFT_395301 [Didymella exigua CBS 183.55]KAF1933319.1 hypothetical protein M421DRAFT_395301 [Didymella exigua CBS 183.55]
MCRGLHTLPSSRSSSPKHDLITRPTTAPGPSGKRTKQGAFVAESGQLLGRGSENTSASEPRHPCPYDPSSYYSFASFEKRRCSLCGMRGPKIVHNEPGHTCKTGRPGSHINSACTYRRHSAIDPRHLAHLANSSGSVLLEPRCVTPERAAKRIGNPPRIFRLPTGIIRLSIASTASASQCRDPVARPPSRLGMRSSKGGAQGSHLQSSHLHSPHINSTGSSTKTPTSPKLHHLSLLPHSENYPFVHKSEIPQHAIALRAGSSSPLNNRTNSPRNAPNMRETSDFSDIVYYGGRKPSLSGNRGDTPKPQATTVVVKQVNVRGSALIDLHASPLDAALAESEMYRKYLPNQKPAKLSHALTDVADSSTSFGSQDTGSNKIGKMRLELKGGDPAFTGIPRLRGGSGHERASTDTFSFKLKRWILFCRYCSRSHDDNDDDLPSARLVAPERVAKMRQKMNGTAPLPAHLCRGTPSIASSSSIPHTNGVAEDLAPATTFTTTILGLPRRSMSSRSSTSLPVPSHFHRRSKSPISQPVTVNPAEILIPPIPYLRGGAESPDKMPPTLFWLAGGTGRKPISFSGWKQSRPKQRTGGLFGMAVFGGNYGQEYKLEASVLGDVECSASVKVTVGDDAGVNDVRGAVDSSSSSSSSSGSLKVEPLKVITAVADEAAPVGAAEPVQRALTPPPTEAIDDAPLCSGALPIDTNADVPGDFIAPSPSRWGKDKVYDVVVFAEKKGKVPEATA